MSPKLKRDVMFLDRESKESLTDKVHILLCSLKELPAEWDDCRSELERALFLIKNMDKMDNMSKAYTDGDYQEFFEAASSKSLAEEDVIPYSQSLAKLHDTQRGIQYAAEEAREEGRAEGMIAGRAEGMVMGRAEGMIAGRAEGERIMLTKIVRELRLKGLDDSHISEMLNQPLPYIQSL